jgi:hypothetical protein
MRRTAGSAEEKRFLTGLSRAVAASSEWTRPVEIEELIQDRLSHLSISIGGNLYCTTGLGEAIRRTSRSRLGASPSAAFITRS